MKDVPLSQTDSRYASGRLLVTLTLMTIGASGMYIVPVVLLLRSRRPQLRFAYSGCRTPRQHSKLRKDLYE